MFEFEGEAWKQASLGQKPRTHLFAVDAGRDPDRLREKYPDPSRYLIVRGVIRPFLQTHRPGDDQPLAEPRLAAWIQEVHPQQVFVPRPHSVGL